MKKLQRPILINAAIVLALLLIDFLFVAQSSNELFFSGTFIILLAPINFIIGIVRNRQHRGDGPYYFLIAGVLLLIGFSVCSLSM